MAISEAEKSKEANRAIINSSVVVATATSSTTANLENRSMEYDWLERSRDPLVTDTNLAEIDFEDFRNEDLAYAFSVGDEESGASSTEMSICRSEALFSSLRDNNGVSGADIGSTGEDFGGSCIQDSLAEGVEVDENLVRGNKNNYQLTYSTQGLVQSVGQRAPGPGPPSAADTPTEGKMTTWSNLGSKQRSRSYSQQQQPVDKASRDSEENNYNNNNNQNGGQSSPGATSKSKSLPDFAGRGGDNRMQVKTPTESKLVSNFMKNRAEVDPLKHLEFECESDSVDGATAAIPMMRSKDTVNQFLKAAAAAASASGSAQRLTSIEERTESRSSSSTSPQQPASTASSSKMPDLGFLQDDVGLWDAFFLDSKNSSKFQSILKQQQHPPALPLEHYLIRQQQLQQQQQQQQQKRHSFIQDSDSLRVLLPSSQKHLLPPPAVASSMSEYVTPRASPIAQVCHSLSQLSTKKANLQEEKDMQNEAIKTMFSLKQKAGDGDGQAGVQVVKVKEAWAETPEKEKVVMRQKPRRRQRTGETEEENLENLINNNSDNNDLKRRSYHNPQDQLLFKVFESSTKGSQRRRRKDFPKSGSQNDLVDAKTPEDELASEAIGNKSRAQVSRSAAEYPLYMNLCVPPQGMSFDLTHKRALFMNLYSAVERLLMYADSAEEPGMTSSSNSIKYILFHEICPALLGIMQNGLKPEVITSFGRMQTSVWRLVEAVTNQGNTSSAGFGTSVGDLIMLLNTRFEANGEDDRKFAGFVAGLLNMSCLHLWFSKLRWSMDVLLRYYERHAFVCALHKETKLLFDEFLFCLQRLYSIPFRLELPFSSELLDQVPVQIQPQQLHHGQCASCRTSCIMDDHSPLYSEATSSNTMTSPGSSSRPFTSRRGSKSRIPRPISLPKRLEAKLGSSPSPVRSNRMIKGQLGTRPSTDESEEASSPTKSSASSRKSRVRETVKIFDTRNSRSSRPPSSLSTPMRPPSGSRRPPRPPRRPPSSGAGEAIASGLDSSGGISRG